MAHEFETGFFVKKPAWHGLGTVVNGAPTIAEALNLAGLNWTVKVEQLGRNTATGWKKSARWAIVRESDDTELGTTGKRWRPLQNNKAFDWFQPILDAGLATLEAAGSLRQGARVWILAKITGNQDNVIVPDSNDRIERYILLAHGHDGLLAIRAGITATRVVCQNTLSTAIAGNTLIRIRHHANHGQTLDAAREIVTKANGDFDKAAEAYRHLASIKDISIKQLKEYVEMVFPSKEPKEEKKDDLSSLLDRPMVARDSVFSPENGDMTSETKSKVYAEVSRLFESSPANTLPGVKGTAWGAFNAMTEYLTHEKGRDAGIRLNNTFFGNDGDRALQSAMKAFT